MAFDGVPWAVENGARVNAAGARAAHYAAMDGLQGIARPGDLKVTATPTPSQSLNVATGSVTVLNQQAPGEAYQALARSTGSVNISVGGASRYDLIVARIIDPDFSPWTTASVPDAVNGPYVDLHVIQGVASTTTKASDVVSYSAYALALVHVPSSGNITNSVITDLRHLARPRESRVKDEAYPTANVSLTSTSYVDFPPASSFQVPVPEWATDAHMTITVSNVEVDGGDTWGNLRAALGSLTGAAVNYDINADVSNPSSNTVIVTWASDVTGSQGETLTAKVQGVRYDPSTFPTITGHLRTLDSTQVLLDVQFYQRTR